MFKKSIFLAALFFASAGMAAPVIVSPAFPVSYPGVGPFGNYVFVNEDAFTANLFQDIKMARDLSYVFMKKYPNQTLIASVYAQKAAELVNFKATKFDKVITDAPSNVMAWGIYENTSWVAMLTKYTNIGYLSEGDALKILADANQRIINEGSWSWYTQNMLIKETYADYSKLAAANEGQKKILMYAFERSTIGAITTIDYNQVKNDPSKLNPQAYRAEKNLAEVSKNLATRMLLNDKTLLFKSAAASVALDAEKMNFIAQKRYAHNIGAIALTLTPNLQWKYIIDASKVVTSKSSATALLLKATQLTIQSETAATMIMPTTILSQTVKASLYRHKLLEQKIKAETQTAAI